MKRGKKSERKKLVEKLDAVFSKFIRERDSGICPICRKREVEQCFHLITRAKYNTRWDTDNCFGSCAGCNYAHEYNPHPATLYWIQKYSQQAYEDLVLKSNQIAKFSNEQLEEMIERFTI